MTSPQSLDKPSVGRMAEWFKAAVLKTRCVSRQTAYRSIQTPAKSMLYRFAQAAQDAHLRQQKRFRVVTKHGTVHE
jgi:hypothetical protein